MLPELEIRLWRPEDAEAVERAVEESREHLRPFMPWAALPPMGIEGRRAWFAERAAAGELLHGAWDHEGRLVGSVGLHPRVGPGGLEIGYWTHVAHVRRGVATAMAAAAVERAFADPAVGWVEIRHDVANVASGNVPARLGFVLVGEHPRSPEAPGETGVQRVWRRNRDALT